MKGMVDVVRGTWCGAVASDVETHGCVCGLVEYLSRTMGTECRKSFSTAVLLGCAAHAFNIGGKSTYVLPIPGHSNSIVSEMGRRDVPAGGTEMRSVLRCYANGLDTRYEQCGLQYGSCKCGVFLFQLLPLAT